MKLCDAILTNNAANQNWQHFFKQADQQQISLQ
jgi:hypothetical protein